MCSELQEILRDMPKGRLTGDLTEARLKQFPAIRREAKVRKYDQPFHSLRKSCARDWAQQHPQHVISRWLGHSSITVTDQYYLQTPESEYDRAAARSIFPE